MLLAREMLMVPLGVSPARSIPATVEGRETGGGGRKWADGQRAGAQAQEAALWPGTSRVRHVPLLCPFTSVLFVNLYNSPKRHR